MSKFILENWEAYDLEKTNKKLDKDYFSCEEKWEVDYLKRKIIEQYPEMSETVILFAIRYTCSNMPAQKKRIDFVEKVAALLEISAS